jgi:hypothetical protein
VLDESWEDPVFPAAEGPHADERQDKDHLG